MLLGLIGDVHAEDELLARTLRFFEEELVDAALCVGDVVDGYGDDDRCVALLQRHGVRSVRGNHERWYLEAALMRLSDPRRPRGLSWRTLRWAAALPSTRRIETPRGPLQLCHGAGADDMALLLPRHGRATLEAHPEIRAARAAGLRFVLCGHSHVRMVRRLGDLTLINGGTLYRRARPGAALVDLESREVIFYDVGEHIRFASRHPL